MGFFSYGGMIAIQTLWAGPWMAAWPAASRCRRATGLFIINAVACSALSGLGHAHAPAGRATASTTHRLIARGLPPELRRCLLAVMRAGPAAGAPAAGRCSASVCTFVVAGPAGGRHGVSAALAGRALSAYNLVIFAGVFVMQWGIGLLIDALLAAGWTRCRPTGRVRAVRGLRAVVSWFLAWRQRYLPTWAHSACNSR